MITARAWAGKRYAVLGLARSGAATVRALVAAGAEVVAWDSDPARREALAPSPSRAEGWGEGTRLSDSEASGSAPHPTLSPLGRGLSIADLDAVDLTDFDALVVSPGVPLNTHPLAARARAAGVPIIGDIELFAHARADLPPHKVVGITGTNGKSTTTALVRHICEAAGLPVLMGGNIGLPILGQEPLAEGGVYVLELSSYQIDLTQTLDCDIAVLLNVTPDHLDRYDGFDAYAASKARLFAMQSAGPVAIVGTGDDASTRIADYLGGRAIRLGDDALDQSRWPALQGPHNAQNAAAAIATARALGIADDVIEQALASFTGLPHRMERVATLGGVTWYDDSKATNPESAAPALAAFPRVHWIVGGRAKGDDLDACLPHLSHVARAYTIGEAGPRFADVLRPHVPVAEVETLERAVRLAAQEAVRGEVVLLSPAAASFDQFRDYEHRGLAFRQAVEALA
jgi:UDP-N-acetylmuramoylalanine--D-glutamate ligase